MQKIINDLLYDTETSELIHTDEKERKLYKTTKGNFFTMYPNGVIEPKTEENVKAFLGEVDVEKYIEIFNEPERA